MLVEAQRRMWWDLLMSRRPMESSMNAVERRMAARMRRWEEVIRKDRFGTGESLTGFHESSSEWSYAVVQGLQSEDFRTR